MRYVSTRGEAPPLGFVDVTLAGLARDGGLYVPETWPQLAPETVAGFAGRPYAEVACEIIRPFVGGAIADRDLDRMVREAYGSFRHPAVAPLVQLGPSTFVLELFHGPTLAFKDLAMQLLGRMMDHCLEARGERTTVVVATHEDLGAMVRELGLERQVEIVGPRFDIGREYQAASVFVLPSVTEGFPNALLEAAASGCACVATDCPGASADILGHGSAGLLVPVGDDVALAAALDSLMGDPGRRDAVGRAACVSAGRFDADTVVGQWVQVLAHARRAGVLRT